MGYLAILLWVLGLVVILKVWEAIDVLVWKPFFLTRFFMKQGVKGPPWKLMSGCNGEIRSLKQAARGEVMDVNSHDFTPRIFPHYLKWKSQYGDTFLYWGGTRPRIFISDVEMVKQILSNKFGFYVKEKSGPIIKAMMGNGLARIEGLDWVRHRRVVSPAFTMDKLKTMAKTMSACTLSMLDMWQDQVIKAKSQSAKIEMSKEFQVLTADVISHTAFGKSYAEGKEVFEAQKELQILAVASFLNINFPGKHYLPTRDNIKRWALERKIKDTLTQIIRGRMVNKNSDYGNDLLGLMMEACDGKSSNKQDNLQLNMDEIIDECKTFFFAGHETTSHLLTWTMFLLSLNQEWQSRLRDEVLRECGTDVPDGDSVSRLKLVTMVLFETLRLYGALTFMMRRAARDMKLGELDIPKGTSLSLPVALIHRSKELWGPDADEFNPMRFENGVSKAAKHPNALLSFSLGPRACVGQNFAMLEARMVLAMILQRFSFTLAPDYQHAPLDIITLQPQFGLPIILRTLND